jgi:lipopolysaccharide transport system ATP-binding protein
MSETAIRVENLGKKYRIEHRVGGRPTNLREAISHRITRLFDLKRRPSVEVEEFWALRDVSFDIARGDVVGIVGRNGAGKSTFLKLLSRITEPTAGAIEFSGRIASLLEVGTGFHQELSGRENIFLNGAILGMPRSEIRRKFGDIVEFAGVEKFLDTPVKHYSSGMYMRLAFAVAAHLETDILLVDEVLAVGDAEFQKKCIGKMQAVAEESGRTVIFVSHNIQAITALCNRTLHLEKGRIVKYGATEDVVPGYLGTGGSASAKWISDDPPSREHPELQLLSVEVSDSHGAAGIYRSSDDLTVSLQFRLFRKLSALCVGFDLVTAEGTTAFRSYQTDQVEKSWPEQIVGIQTWRCKIPAGLLNAGHYSISPRIGIHNVKWISALDSVVQFEVILDHGVSPLWNSLSGKARPGIVAPIFSWSAEPGAAF